MARVHRSANRIRKFTMFVLNIYFFLFFRILSIRFESYSLEE